MAQKSVWSPPSGSVRRGEALAARTLGESDDPILLLHGLVGSQRYWGSHFDALAQKHRLIVPDLLGFGQSAHPKSDYDVNAHVKALVDTLIELGTLAPMTVVGHSTGCIIALGLAAQHPQLVSSVLCFSPAFYENARQARKRISKMGLMQHFFALDTKTARATCEWMCKHRDFAANIAERFSPGLPPVIARDGVQHTIESYFGTMNQVIVAAQAGEFLQRVQVPVRLIAGTNDTAMDLPYLIKLTSLHQNVSLVLWCGLDHQIPLRVPKDCVEEVEKLTHLVGDIVGPSRKTVG